MTKINISHPLMMATLDSHFLKNYNLIFSLERTAHHYLIGSFARQPSYSGMVIS